MGAGFLVAAKLTHADAISDELYKYISFKNEHSAGLRAYSLREDTHASLLLLLRKLFVFWAHHLLHTSSACVLTSCVGQAQITAGDYSWVEHICLSDGGRWQKTIEV